MFGSPSASLLGFLWRSGAARKIRAEPSLHQACSAFATGPRQDVGTVYELRTYEIIPSKPNEFLEVVNKSIHVRLAHSELIGYWMVEVGAMNKAFHIWKFDNFAHRAAVRAALSKDQEWQEKLSAIRPLLHKQDMEVAYLVPWCELATPPKPGVYELVTYQLKPGGPALWGDSFKAAIEAHVSKGYGKLIGVFHTEYGLLNTVNVLWWYEDPDSRAAGRHLAHEDARVVAAVRESVQFLESQRNMLLIPTPFSPLKPMRYTECTDQWIKMAQEERRKRLLEAESILRLRGPKQNLSGDVAHFFRHMNTETTWQDIHKETVVFGCISHLVMIYDTFGVQFF